MSDVLYLVCSVCGCTFTAERKRGQRPKYCAEHAPPSRVRARRHRAPARVRLLTQDLLRVLAGFDDAQALEELARLADAVVQAIDEAVKR